MNKRKLSILIAAALSSLSGAVQASPEELTRVSEYAFEQIEHLKALAERGEGTFEKGGRTYLRYQGHEYLVNFDHYPSFPFMLGGNDSAYRAVMDGLDDRWTFMMNDGGFYLMNQDLGGINYDETLSGCYIQYSPAARGTPVSGGGYAWEAPMVQRIEASDCRDLAPPAPEKLVAHSVSDQGVFLVWSEDESASATLSLFPESDPAAKRQFANVSPGFFIGELTPDTTYQAELSFCKGTSCSETKTLTFTTAPARLGFADEQPVTNSLAGDLEGLLTFAQTNTNSAPYGNEHGLFPDPVMKRAALLLFTPTDNTINQLWLEVYQSGELIHRMPMTPPSALPENDQPDNGRTKVVYSHYAWSANMQWDWMQPGLSLRISDNTGRTGELPETGIYFGGAPELVIQNIDMGMLTPPRGQNTMIKQMATLAADYYQKIPVSKLVMADYTPTHFEKVTMPNGKVYTTKSDSTGGWHSGDMREAIGKALVSTGINNANFGISDSAGASQQYNRHRGFNHITAHTNVGVYTHPSNGGSQTVVHGGSGGGGIVTLEGTTGNEWSHELGHNYGLGHYPYMASVHDQESGWGWDAFYQRFIGNLHWTGEAYTQEQGGEIVPPFKGEFRFTRDAQNGGEAERVGTISRFTLEHPAQSRKTQNWLNQAANLDSSSPSGYVRWNGHTQAYDVVQTDAPKPSQTGVPVVTLLGVYDPMNQLPSQIYPPLYSNYGNVFDLPQSADIDFQVEGWQPVTSLTDTQLNADIWRKMRENGELKRICQFTFTASNGQTANFVGAENPSLSRCEAGEDMYWDINGSREAIVSQPNDYALLSKFGNGKVTYQPTADIGEQELCILDKGDINHEGAGFVKDNACQQLPDIKHKGGADWYYSSRKPDIWYPRFDSQRVCTLTVTRHDGSQEQIQLANSRHNGTESNKFHVNLPMTVPAQVTLSCEDAQGETVLDTLTPDQNPPIDKLNGPVVIGQEQGYRQVVKAMPTFNEHQGLKTMDFASFSEFDAYVAAHWGGGEINNGVTSNARRTGALYVYANPNTGTRDYFIMADENAGPMPNNRQSNDDWHFLGSADDHVNLALNPVKLNRNSGVDTATRVAQYFGQDRVLSWDERTTTKWGESENAVFATGTEESGERRYFIQKRPGQGGEFPWYGSNDDWYFVGSDTTIERLVTKLKSSVTTFEDELLTWYKQDTMHEWGDNGTYGNVNDIYVYHFRGGEHYYRLKTHRYGYFPWPTDPNASNHEWEYLGRYYQ
ncbi:M66 family metalloprotease [Grimontia hollisae]|uniref:M66 family metalloprotease n=1 Tax=Grimontia hollisae TaxID=673 RepID=UPI000E03FA59|nr:M66 family metalloprotease [Grimontia hollisae]STQ77019.1 Metalloprotease stcE precursor [Grimontia hollisae]